MGLGIALEVAIGLIFFFLLLSLFTTVIVELIGGWLLKLRQKNFTEALKNLVSDGDTFGQILNAPSIQTVYRMSTGAAPDPATSTNAPSQMAARSFALGVMEWAEASAQEDGKTGIDAIDALPDDIPFARAIKSEIRDAGADTAAVITRIEGLYNRAMDRAAGFYQREIRKVTIITGLVLAIMFNADTIHVGETLWFDGPARAAIVESAGNVTARSSLPNYDVSDISDRLGGFPIGWSADNRPEWAWDEGWAWASKFIGILLTALALSLGAPFWFDMLKRVMNIRAMGRRETSESDASQGENVRAAANSPSTTIP